MQSVERFGNMIELIPTGEAGAARREWTGAAVLWAFLSLPARVRRRAATRDPFALSPFGREEGEPRRDGFAVNASKFRDD